MTILKRKTHKPQAVETIAEPEQGFAQVAFADIDIAIDNKLTSAELRLWLYLEKVKPSKPTSKELAKRLGTSPRTIEKAIDRLAELGLCEPPNRIQHTYIEKAVRDRLHSQLNGLIEVGTLAGRIDLLTNTEIIEVKHVSEWKSAMGQVLAYSSFYPKHSKRIHLWGRKGEMASATAVTTCLELNIAVTFQEVEL